MKHFFEATLVGMTVGACSVLVPGYILWAAWNREDPGLAAFAAGLFLLTLTAYWAANLLD